MNISEFIDQIDPWDPELIQSYVQVLRDWE